MISATGLVVCGRVETGKVKTDDIIGAVLRAKLHGGRVISIRNYGEGFTAASAGEMVGE
jgi:translation elongation factor EF-Tu-like GTPase